MSRPGQPTTRNLSLTEELERLEQSITLTLQEIDHNFSRAHRIVTSSILPLVEQYGEHSRSVWEASKFWKQFFEASANVSLSGYEELANGEDTTAMTTDGETTVQDETTATYTPRPRSAGRDNHRSNNNDNNNTTTTFTADESSAFHDQGSNTDDSVLTDADGDLTGSTPRPPTTKTLSVRPQMAGLDSPYEALKREFKSEAAGAGTGAADNNNNNNNADEESDSELLFQQHTARLPDMSMTPRSSLGGAGHDGAGRGGRTGYDDSDDDERDKHGKKKNHDPLLHRMLDKNYRVMATPHRAMATGVSPIKWKVNPRDDDAGGGKGKDKERRSKPVWQDSPMSSPEMAVPQLRSAAFMSPVRAAYRGKLTAAAVAAARGQAAAAAPRTPGVSVQTPMAGRKVRDVYGGKAEEDTRYEDEITWEESDSDEFAGMSPPKTIQFALPPSKLLQTPAREASKRIVEGILLTAGAEPDSSEEYSPTMVKMNPDILDDTF